WSAMAATNTTCQSWPVRRDSSASARNVSSSSGVLSTHRMGVSSPPSPRACCAFCSGVASSGTVLAAKTNSRRCGSGCRRHACSRSSKQVMSMAPLAKVFILQDFAGPETNRPRTRAGSGDGRWRWKDPPPSAASDDAHGLDQAHHGPGLGLGDGPAFGDFDRITLVVLVGFVVRLVLGGTVHELAQHGVLHAGLDADDDRLVHLVADDLADQRTLTLGGVFLGFGGHVTFLRSQS